MTYSTIRHYEIMTDHVNSASHSDVQFRRKIPIENTRYDRQRMVKRSQFVTILCFSYWRIVKSNFEIHLYLCRCYHFKFNECKIFTFNHMFTTINWKYVQTQNSTSFFKIAICLKACFLWIAIFSLSNGTSLWDVADDIPNLCLASITTFVGA